MEREETKQMRPILMRSVYFTSVKSQFEWKKEEEIAAWIMPRSE